VDDVFDRLKVRMLGPQSVSKKIYVNYTPHYSLPGIFQQAAKEEGAVANLKHLHQILKVAGSYIDAAREKTKARAVHEVQTFLADAQSKGVATDLETVLGGKLTQIWSETASGVRKIIDSEATHTRNVGTLDGIIRINASVGIEDPWIYFVVVRDASLCEECKRLHLMPDGVTPRVWRLSDVGHGYHHKGESNPKMGGLHPHCRCSLVTLMPGYGFDAKGMISYISRDHNERKRQQDL
jgi:hypothetical protein